MKQISLFVVAAIVAFVCSAQNIPDSFLHQYNNTPTPHDRQLLINHYSSSSIFTDSARIASFLELRAYFEKNRDKMGVAQTEEAISYRFFNVGDMSLMLKYALTCLPVFEEARDTVELVDVYSDIGYSLSSQKLPESETYWRKALAIANKRFTSDYCTLLNNVANYFKDWQKPDSALVYGNAALNLATETHDTSNMGPIFSTIGETYLELKQFDIAKSFVSSAIDLQKRSNDRHSLAFTWNDLAQLFFETSVTDSSIYFARLNLQTSYPTFLLESMNACNILYQNFDKLNEIDSSNKYFRLSAAIKDSIASDEKTRNIQSLALQEQVRVHDLEVEKEEIARQHTENLENVLIALGIILFLIVFFVSSRRLITSTTLIRFLGIMALLMVFEFINLLVHPFFEKITYHSQVFMLLLLTALAALLIPLHHRMEKWMIARMVEKNRHHRLASAKRTIEKLGPKDSADIAP